MSEDVIRRIFCRGLCFVEDWHCAITGKYVCRVKCRDGACLAVGPTRLSRDEAVTVWRFGHPFDAAVEMNEKCARIVETDYLKDIEGLSGPTHVALTVTRQRIARNIRSIRNGV